MQKISEDPLTVCPGCGGKLRKMISNTSFVLKGTGWYATDYASDAKGKKDRGAKSEKTAAPKAEKKEPEKKSAAKETAAAK